MIRQIKLKIVPFMIGCLFACQIASAQSQHAAVRTNNPIITDMIADPSIIKIEGMYYCYATTDGFNHGLSSSGPPVVWKSKDLVNWSFKGFYFPSATHQLYWAPSAVQKVKDKYFIYPTINTNIYVATADRPDGPFKLANGEDTFGLPNSAKPLVKLKGAKGTKGIDAELFINDDKQAYLFWAEHGAGKLSADLLSVDTLSIVKLTTKRAGYSEGPIVFKRKGIYYYLYTLSGHENYEYAYGYSTESPLGPYIFPEKDIIASTDKKQHIYGPGHGSVFVNNATGQYYFTYLEFGNGGPNRQVWINELNFNADGTIRPVVLTHTGVVDHKAFKPERNLAVGMKVTTSSTLADLKVRPVLDTTLRRMERYFPENAIDQSNGTRWMADTTSTDRHPVFTLDLVKLTAIRRTEAYFVTPTAGHAYQLEYSNDGKLWHPYGGHDDVRVQSPHVDELAVKTRYLRLTILAGIPGLWEFKVY